MPVHAALTDFPGMHTVTVAMADRYSKTAVNRRCIELLRDQVYGHPVGNLFAENGEQAYQRPRMREGYVPPGTISIARWWSYTTHDKDRRYVHVVDGRHAALRMVYAVDLRMASEQQHLSEFVSAIMRIEHAIVSHSPLLDKQWPHLTKPLRTAVVLHRRDRERLQNWLKRDAFSKLSRARRGRDRTGRRNYWGCLWQIAAARWHGLEPRIQDLHSMRKVIQARTEVLWRENQRCRQIWNNLRALTKTALWRRDPAGALRRPDCAKARTLRENLRHAAADLRTLQLAPDAQASYLALTDLDELNTQLSDIGHYPHGVFDPVYQDAWACCHRIYTGCRGVDLVEELGLGLLLDLGVAHSLQEEPRPAVQVVFSKCNLLIDWLVRVRDQALEQPFKQGALTSLTRAREAAHHVLRNEVGAVEGIREIKQHVQRCIRHVAYGEERS